MTVLPSKSNLVDFGAQLLRNTFKITYHVSHLYVNMKSPVQPLLNHLQLQLPHLLTLLLLSLMKKWLNQGRQEVVVILDDHLQMIPKMIRNNIIVGKYTKN